MTAPHYYASTSGILVDRFLKYGLYPIAYGLGYARFGRYGEKAHELSRKYAQMVCFAAAAGITTTFLGLESDMINDSSAKAVSAAMGVDPQDVEFSDYRKANNIIARKATHDLIRLQKYRYGTDLLFLLPTMIKSVYEGVTHHTLPRSRDVLANPDHYSPLVRFLQSHVGFAMSTYAAKAAYWTYETFAVKKTAYYEVIKVRENLEATGKDIEADDIKAIYQRARTDQGLPMINKKSKQENDAIRSLCRYIADAYNERDGKMGMSEIVYLIGENKLNIHAPDRHTFSEEAVAQSYKEIDKVLSIGLGGIREENRAKREERGDVKELGRVAKPPHKSFADRVGDRSINSLQSILRRVGLVSGRTAPEEYMSPRDPTSIIGLSRR